MQGSLALPRKEELMKGYIHSKESFGTVDGPGIRLANEVEAKKLLSELEERNQTLKDGTWYERFREVALSLPRYRFLDEALHEKMAHFLDCEAHYDVMKEVYQTYNVTNELD